MRRDLTDLPLRFRPVFSCLIVYDAVRRPIEIVSVLHGARDLKRILSERA
jgi:plasmid stabilization system protein ParE